MLKRKHVEITKKTQTNLFVPFLSESDHIQHNLSRYKDLWNKIFLQQLFDRYPYSFRDFLIFLVHFSDPIVISLIKTCCKNHGISKLEDIGSVEEDDLSLCLHWQSQQPLDCHKVIKLFIDKTEMPIPWYEEACYRFVGIQIAISTFLKPNQVFTFVEEWRDSFNSVIKIAINYFKLEKWTSYRSFTARLIQCKTQFLFPINFLLSPEEKKEYQEYPEIYRFQWNEAQNQIIMGSEFLTQKCHEVPPQLRSMKRTYKGYVDLYGVAIALLHCQQKIRTGIWKISQNDDASLQLIVNNPKNDQILQKFIKETDFDWLSAGKICSSLLCQRLSENYCSEKRMTRKYKIAKTSGIV